MDTFSNRLAPTRAFIREHFVPLNNIVLLAGFAVAALDFLAPRLSMLPTIVFGATGALCCVLLLSAFTPGLLNRAVARLMMVAEGKALRASPPWQLSVALLALITLLGGASLAKADSGGIIASSSNALASAQSSLLGLHARTAEIKVGTDRANAKLDAIAVKLESPSFAGDACPEIECALGMGASKAALEKLLARGARLPTEPHAFGAALDRLSKGRNPARMGAVSVYLETKALPDINARALVVSRFDPHARGLIATQLPPPLRSRADDMLGHRGQCDMGAGMRLTELAALNGDQELYDWLLARGADPALTNTWCKEGPFATPFTAERLMAQSDK